MNIPFLDKFSLRYEKEELSTIVKSIDNGVVFRGTNLWVLIFAIFVASLGLNVNSTAVIIGAMLISPLMGPIMGLGLGLGIHDIALLKKAAHNYLVATGVALATSTLFFLVSPLDDAHSEILARTSPTLYDVLIALFGGFAGIIATSSRNKGNVIPGVAIATALMPPLCTAGYGLATLQFRYFFGAFYLYIINTVFIAWATFIIVRVLHFPTKHLQNERAEKIAQRLVWMIVVLTLLPSVYFGYQLVQENKFVKDANLFIAYEANFTNDYLLNKTIDPDQRTISLIFGGQEITKEQIEELKQKLDKYNLKGTKLEIKQGFAYLAENKLTPGGRDINQLKQALDVNLKQQEILQMQIDSIKREQELSRQVFDELKIQYPAVKNAFIQPGILYGVDQNKNKTLIVLVNMSKRPTAAEQNKMEKWLKTRMKADTLQLIVQ